MLRLTAFISGIGVKAGYAKQALIQANSLKLTGYLQNLPDGRMKVVAEGTESNLDIFAGALGMSDALFDVLDIERKYSPCTGDFTGFSKMAREYQWRDIEDMLEELLAVYREELKQVRAIGETLKDPILK